MDLLGLKLADLNTARRYCRIGADNTSALAFGGDTTSTWLQTQKHGMDHLGQKQQI